jgi:hypothetical protein
VHPPDPAAAQEDVKAASVDTRTLDPTLVRNLQKDGPVPLGERRGWIRRVHVDGRRQSRRDGYQRTPAARAALFPGVQPTT